MPPRVKKTTAAPAAVVKPKVFNFDTKFTKVIKGVLNLAVAYHLEQLNEINDPEKHYDGVVAGTGRDEKVTYWATYDTLITKPEHKMKGLASVGKPAVMFFKAIFMHLVENDESKQRDLLKEIVAGKIDIPKSIINLAQDGLQEVAAGKEVDLSAADGKILYRLLTRVAYATGNAMWEKTREAAGSITVGSICTIIRDLARQHENTDLVNSTIRFFKFGDDEPEAAAATDIEKFASIRAEHKKITAGESKGDEASAKTSAKKPRAPAKASPSPSVSRRVIMASGSRTPSNATDDAGDAGEDGEEYESSQERDPESQEECDASDDE